MINVGEKQRTTRLYRILAQGVVPVYTILFACQGHLIETNLSQLGNRPGHYARFVVWGLVCTLVHYMLFSRAFALAQYQSPAARGLMTGACGAFLLCVLLPFVPGRFPRAATWHNKLGILSTVLTTLTSLSLAIHLRKVDRKLCLESVLLWAVQFGVCFYLLQRTGISGLVEALFIASTSVLTCRILVRLEERGAEGAYDEPGVYAAETEA